MFCMLCSIPLNAQSRASHRSFHWSKKLRDNFDSETQFADYLQVGDRKNCSWPWIRALSMSFLV
jgi:hypothetical protein